MLKAYQISPAPLVVTLLLSAETALVYVFGTLSVIDPAGTEILASATQTMMRLPSGTPAAPMVIASVAPVVLLLVPRLTRSTISLSFHHSIAAAMRQLRDLNQS